MDRAALALIISTTQATITVPMTNTNAMAKIEGRSVSENLKDY